MEENKTNSVEEEIFNYTPSFTLNSSKHEHELFNDDDNIKFPLINIKRINLPKKKIEDWQILVDGKVMLVLKGTRFSNKEKEYLRTLDGIKFVIDRKSVV